MCTSRKRSYGVASRSNSAAVISSRETTRPADRAVEADAKGCRIQLQGDSQGLVTGSRELVRRAIENVLRNAIRYSPEKSWIEVRMEDGARETSIIVRDYGPGVPEETLARLFDPFFRVEEARDANGGGSGLGLSIAKRAVQAHQGTIAAENARPGLRVRIVLPAMAEPAEAAQGERALRG